MTHLVPCLSCQRHVSVADERCPFCGVELSAEQRGSVPPELPRRRLGRAALFTFGATLVSGAACSDGSHGGNDAGTDVAAADGARDGGGGAGTGGAGTGGSGTGGTASGGAGGNNGTGGKSGTGGIAPPYGIGPLYGAPPVGS